MPLEIQNAMRWQGARRTEEETARAYACLDSKFFYMQMGNVVCDWQLTRFSGREKLGYTIGDAGSCRKDSLSNHSMDRKDFFFGDAVAEGELRRFCRDDGQG